MSRELYNKESREKLLAGVNKIAKAVGITLGSKGRTVIINKGYGYPIETKDGYTVAKNISSDDPFESIGVELVKEVACKTNDDVQDGTTTGTVLAGALVNKGIELVDNGYNEIKLKNELEKCGEKVLNKIKEMSIPIKDEDIVNVASISANDKVIGQKIAEAINIVGREGIITVENSGGFEMEIETVKGIRLQGGYLSPWMVTNPEKMETSLTNVPILITDKKIELFSELKAIKKKLEREDTKILVIIANGFSDEVLNTMITNKVSSEFFFFPIKAPGYGVLQKDMLQDIAILVGANLISDETGGKLEKAEWEDLGEADKVVSNKSTTNIIQGHGTPEKVEERKSQVKCLIESSTGFEKVKLNERLGMLNGGAVIIKVGANTETEMTEVKHRIEDAVGSTKAAISEGIVSGGGMALIKASECLGESEVEQMLKRVLEEPARVIAENAGENGDEIIEKIRESGLGYNASTGEFGDMIALGIIDPAKVTRMALTNALSIASGILRTGGIVDATKKK